MVKLVCIVEIMDARTEADAQRRLDAFREAVQPFENFEISIYRPTNADLKPLMDALWWVA